MRTSNKILLTVFLAMIVALTTIHVTLFAKYKTGDFITLKEAREEQFDRHDLKKVNYIVASGLENFTIIPSDTLRLEIEKGHMVKFFITGDSLVIHGDSNTTAPGEKENRIRSSQEVNLYLPSAEKITADFCDVELKAAKDSSSAKMYDFDLVNTSNFHISGNNYNDSAYKYINRLFIKASNSSVIEFTKYVSIAELKMVLNDSQFDDKDASINKLTMDADKSSTLTLKGDHLRKLNLAQHD
jgi:hypothetical protein